MKEEGENERGVWLYEVKDVQRTPHGLQILIVWTASDRASDLSCKASLVLRIDVFHLPSCSGLLMTPGAHSSFLALYLLCHLWTSSHLHQKGEVMFEFHLLYEFIECIFTRILSHGNKV